MFALTLQASVAASAQRFEQVIAHVKEIRDAWREVAAGSLSRHSDRPLPNLFIESLNAHAKRTRKPRDPLDRLTPPLAIL